MAGKALRPERQRHLCLVDGEDWQDFLDEHPELAADSPPEGEPELTAETVLDALRKEIDQSGGYWKGAAWASCVLKRIHAPLYSPEYPRRSGLVADRLRRLADEGRVRPLGIRLIGRALAHTRTLA